MGALPLTGRLGLRSEKIGSATDLAICIGALPDVAANIGMWGGATVGAEKLSFRVGGVNGPVMTRSGTDVNLSIPATTASTSSTTGALVVGGGLGVAGAGFFGGEVSATNAYRFGTQTVLVGNYAAGAGTNPIAIGSGTDATTAPSVAGNYGIAIGSGSVTGARAGGHNSIAIGGSNAGNGASASGADSIAIGRSATAAFANSIAIGLSAIATKANQIRLGDTTNHTEISIPTTTASTSSTTGALVVGGGLGIAGAGFFGGEVSATSAYRFASQVAVVGNNAAASGTNDVVIGSGSDVTKAPASTGVYGIAIGSGSVTGARAGSESVAIGGNNAGNGARAGGTQGVAIGAGASAVNNRSVCIGFNASSMRNNTVVIGCGANVTSGDNNVVIGSNETGTPPTSGGPSAMAIGPGQGPTLAGPNASGLRSIAFGVKTTAAHQDSVAIGTGAATTKASQIVLGSTTYHTEVSIPATTVSTNNITGALVVVGGIGLAGAINAGAASSINANAAALIAGPTGTLLHAAQADTGVSRVLADAFANYGIFTGRRANGTAASPTALLSGDEITHLSAWGRYDGSNYSASYRAAISLWAAENWSSTAQGTRISFYTTAVTTTTTAEKVRIWSDGGVQIGGTFTASPGAGALHVTGKLTVDGLIDPTGLALTPVAANPGGALATTTIWSNSTDSNKLYYGASAIGGSGGLGDVVGPSSAVDGGVALFDGTTGKLIKDGGALGTAAFAATGDFATAAQGGLADTAVQPGDLATVATSGAYSDLSGTPTLGTAAAEDVGYFATAAQGGLADTATQPGDLATVATSGSYSDLSGTPTLGTAAAENVGYFATAAQGGLADTAVQPGDLATVATTGAYSDLSGTPTLGTAAAEDVGYFATAAQGGLADTAVQPGDLAAVATSGSYADLSNTPTLGTAAAEDVGYFATAAQGGLADTAVQPGDLATVATSGAYSDLSGTPTLGTAAAEDVGAFATAAQGGLADTAVQPGDLATVATSGDYMDLSNIPSSFTPADHASTHLGGGSDALLPADSAGFLQNDGAGNLSWGAGGSGGGDQTRALNVAAADIGYTSGAVLEAFVSAGTPPSGAVVQRIMTVAFDSDADRFASWDIGSFYPNYSGQTLTLTIEWMTDATTGDCTWKAAFAAFNSGDALTNKVTAAMRSTTTSAPGTAKTVVTTTITFTQVQADAVAAGDSVVLLLGRDTVAGTPLSGKAKVTKLSLSWS